MNIVFHSVGCYLLIHLRKNGRETVEGIYLISLSTVDIYFNSMDLIIELAMLSGNDSPTLRAILCYILIMTVSGMNVIYYLILIVITIDKLLDVLLNIKYPVIWNEEKAIILTKVIWMIGTLICICVSVVYHFTRFNIGYIINVFLTPFDIFFIISRLQRIVYFSINSNNHGYYHRKI